MARSITCTNNDGSTITFGETAFSPFLLAHIDGIYAVENDVVITNNSMADGGVYQGSVAKVRNIVLTITDRPENRYALPSREVLYKLFPKGTKGTLSYNEDGEIRKIDYYVESIRSGAANKRLFTISLLCPDPFFYAASPITVYMAAWNGAFEFPHNFIAIGEEIGYRSASRLQAITNENAADNIGMDIVISANGSVSNPSVIRVESNEHITVGYSGKDLNMVAGDSLRITTSTNDKHVYFTHNGVTEEINQYLTEDSVFIQLMRGTNSIGYDADVGLDNMVVEVSYRLRYEGA